MNKLVWIAALALLSGCVTETSGARVLIDTQSGEASVLECSPRLANTLSVAKVTYGEASEGIRRATVTLKSETRKRQRLHVRMVWADEDGVEIDADGKPYRTIVLDGMDLAVVTGVAPNSRAVKARVQVRDLETVE